jgi:thiol-disulfide isomerase/thioredoxin
VSANASNRRRWLGVAVAAAAAAVGVGAYLVQRRAGDAPPDEAADALWALGFDTPQGGRLQMQSLRGRPLVLNFWATWCPPCVREMPALQRFHVDHAAQGWQVLGVAADNPGAVRDFLARSPVTFAIAMAGFEGIEWSRRLGNLSGGLPFTLVFDSAGQVAHRHMGESTYDQLAGWAKTIS